MDPRVSRPFVALLVFLSLLGVATGQKRVSSDSGDPAAGGGRATVGQGGAANADFDTLIDLIVSTVATETWAETGGGEAEIRPFPNGVWLDPAGVIANRTPPSQSAAPPPRRPPAPPSKIDGPRASDPRRDARLRCVSLPRLEAEILRRSLAGEPLDEAMLTLAGLRRVERVYVYPARGAARGDLVIAGPAGDWRVDDGARLVAADTGEAVPRLDDLIGLLRREWATPGAPLGCSITPRQENLAATQRYLDRSGQEPLRPGRQARNTWLEGVRASLGRQDVEVWGIDPATNAARALVEADHHMKRVGLGVVDSVDGVRSYLDRVARTAEDGGAVSPLSVIRWWFAADYEGVERSEAGDAFRLVGPGARVLSENELLTIRGERVHTGRSDPATEGFAEEFTAHFAELCRAYPVYGELRNVFDLAVVAALMRAENLPALAGWWPTLFLQGDRLPTPRLRVAREVDTLAANRVVQRTRVLAAVSGGVWIDTKAVLAARPRSGSARGHPPKPVAQQGGVWWWNAPP